LFLAGLITVAQSTIAAKGSSASLKSGGSTVFVIDGSSSSPRRTPRRSGVARVVRVAQLDPATRHRARRIEVVNGARTMPDQDEMYVLVKGG
jgi:hypothetical protein